MTAVTAAPGAFALVLLAAWTVLTVFAPRRLPARRRRLPAAPKTCPYMRQRPSLTRTTAYPLTDTTTTPTGGSS